MFEGAAAFNQPIGAWNVTRVLDMHAMFEGAAAFNQPIGAWDVSWVRDMCGMFLNAAAFNQPVGAWDVGRVRNLDWMFVGAYSFRQLLSTWRVGDLASRDCPFQMIRVGRYFLAGELLDLHCSPSDPTSAMTFLRANDMVLTLRSCGHRSWVLWRLPTELVREVVAGWIGLSSQSSNAPYSSAS
jgi:hypothetical protein